MLRNGGQRRSMTWQFVGAALLSGALVLSVSTPALAVVPDGWSTPSTLSDTGHDADRTQLVAAPDGTLIAAWIRFNGTEDIVQASSSTDYGATWTAPANVSAAGGSAGKLKLAVSPVDGALVAIWLRDEGSGERALQASSSIDHGALWSTPVNLSGTDSDDPQLVAAPNGTFTAIWTFDNGTDVLVLTRSLTAPAASWSSAEALSFPAGNASDPDIVVAPDGTLTAIWARNDLTESFVQTRSLVPPSIAWSFPEDLTVSGDEPADPILAVAPNGDLTALWVQDNGSEDVVHTSSLSGTGGTWTSNIALSAAGGDADDLHIASAPDGTIIALWSREVTDSLVQTRYLTGPGGSWSSTVDLSSSGTDAYSPKLAIAQDGTIMAIWEGNPGSISTMQTRSLTAPGAAWAPIVNISTAGADASNPQIAVTPDGIFAAIWYGYDGSYDVIQSAFGRIAPLITSATPPTPVVGTPYSFPLAASGTPESTFSVSSGALPPGLSLSPAGLISGNPTAGGSFTFTISADNGQAPLATATYTLTAAAVLAATGANIPIPFIVGGGLALVAGLALLLISRIRLYSN